MNLSKADIATALANGGSLSKSLAETLAAQPLAAQPPAPQKRYRGKIKPSDGVLFIAACKAHGLPRPRPEYQFAMDIGRKWAFDWAWPRGENGYIEPMFGGTALEIQGGIWTKGRHTRGAALLKEWEKLNEAAIRNWRILYCQPEDVESGAVFEVLKRALR